jgi:hypothetical protein
MIMGNKENELAVLLTLNDNDKVRIVTASGQSAQTTYGDLKQAIIGGIQIGGRNYLRNSGVPVTNSNYPTATYTLSAPIAEGEECTVTIWGSLGEGKGWWSIYNTGDINQIVDIHPSDQIADGVYRKTFNWFIGSSTNESIWVYPIYSAVVVDSTINQIKLERGNKATDWSPAPEDIQSQIDEIRALTGN